eukprot:UN03377
MILTLQLIFQCKLLQVIKSYIKSIQSAQTNMRKKEIVELITLSDPVNVVTHSNASNCNVSDVSTANVCVRGIRIKSASSECTRSEAATPDHQKKIFVPSETKKERKLRKVVENVKLEFVNTTTQHSMLVFVSVMTSWLVLIIFFITRSAFLFKFFISLDCFINTLCLFLHFPFSIRIFKCLCPNKLCLLCIGKCIDKNVRFNT